MGTSIYLHVYLSKVLYFAHSTMLGLQYQPDSVCVHVFRHVGYPATMQWLTYKECGCGDPYFPLVYPVREGDVVVEIVNITTCHTNESRMSHATSIALVIYSNQTMVCPTTSTSPPTVIM